MVCFEAGCPFRQVHPLRHDGEPDALMGEAARSGAEPATKRRAFLRGGGRERRSAVANQLVVSVYDAARPGLQGGPGPGYILM